MGYEPDVQPNLLAFQIFVDQQQAVSGEVNIPPVILVGKEFGSEEIDIITRSGVKIGEVLTVSPIRGAKDTLRNIAKAVASGKIETLSLFTRGVVNHYEYDVTDFEGIEGIVITRTEMEANEGFEPRSSFWSGQLNQEEGFGPHPILHLRITKG